MLRFLIITGLIALIFTALSPIDTWAQNWEDVTITAEAATGNVYMLTGQGGNIGVVINEDHVIVIDSQFEPLFDKILETIRELTDKPVRYLINTHWHGDHVGGNALFNNEGAALIAHENVKSRLESGGKVEFFGMEMAPQPDAAVPDLTFDDEVTIDMGSETLHIFHVPGGHTDGDGIVHLKENNVLHMGDTYFAKMYPFIDLGSGGTIEGAVAACERALALCDEETRIIPGHGPLSNTAELRTFTAMLADVADWVGTAKSGGASLKEVAEMAAEKMQKYDAEFGKGFIDAKTLVTFAYNSL